MEIKLSGHVISNVGIKKIANEDNYLINNMMNEASLPISESQSEWNENSKYLYYAGVFDGMGGGACGQQASRFAAEEFTKILDKVPMGTAEQEIDKLAGKGFLSANRRILEERKHHAILGTTATLLCLRKNRAKLFHLGDSRAYLFRENRLVKLTKDQTLASMKLEAGIYQADDPEIERDKNFLTEYVGADETLTSLKPLESDWFSLQPSDKLLLCSDGLYHVCADEEIKAVLQLDKAAESLADKLVCAALKKGGTDNITCLVVTIQNNEESFRG